MHEYPVCEKHTDKIHDYREQVIKDIPAFGKFVSQEEQIPFFRVTPTNYWYWAKKAPHTDVRSAWNYILLMLSRFT